MSRWPSNATTDERPLRPSTKLLVPICAFVLLFRAAAWLDPSGIVAVARSLALPLNGLGVLFLACGVWAFRSNPSPLTRVFLVYGIGSAIHWGGSIAAESPDVETAFLMLYAAASAMGDGAFLDLAVRYPRALARQPLYTMWFYLPALLTFVVLPLGAFLPERLVETGLGLVFLSGFLMSIAGGFVFLAKWVRTTAFERRQFLLTPIVGALVVSSGLDLMGNARWLPGEPEVWALFYGLVPLVIAGSLSRERARTANGGVTKTGRTTHGTGST